MVTGTCKARSSPSSDTCLREEPPSPWLTPAGSAADTARSKHWLLVLVLFALVGVVHGVCEVPGAGERACYGKRQLDVCRRCRLRGAVRRRHRA
jgi:hypothetical protein